MLADTLGRWVAQCKFQTTMIVGLSQSEMGNEIKRETGKENARMSASVYQ